MKNIIDAHYFLLPSQGNVYSLKQICMSNGNNKILAASLRRKVFSLEYNEDSSGYLKPSVREVLFTYIPSGAEIISIDVFNKSQSSDDFVIGITIIKSSNEQSMEMYLNIYSEWEPSSEFNLESVAQNCLILELNFIPYQLYHTWIPNSESENKEVVWLLAGSDVKIHMFREDRLNHCYSEVDVAEHFPEFAEPPSIVLWMDIYYTKHSLKRVTAFGCECGYVKVTVAEQGNIMSSWTAQFEGPVSRVSLFTLKSVVPCPSFVDVNCDTNLVEEPAVHLLVSNSLQPSVVYMNVLEEGLSKVFSLPGSDQFDAVLCACIADVNMDGKNEIVLGTYGQEILQYKYTEKTNANSDCWTLESQHSFATPIHSILYVDITGDGVKELIVLTMRGVHILQHSPDEVNDVITKKFKNIKLNSEL